MNKLYKVLNEDFTSPFKNFKFEIGKEYHCSNFDESEEMCSNGFYATDLDGLIYSFDIHKKVFECEVWGKEKEFSKYKRRYENIKIAKEISHIEIRNLLDINKIDEKEGFKYTEALFPINPFLIERNKIVSKEEIELLRQWASVGASVGVSVWASVWDSVWDSVRASVRDSVWASVRDSVWGYISSLFPAVKFIYDFSSCVKLWKAGLIPSFDGKIWRLHSGINAKVIFKIEK